MWNQDWTCKEILESGTQLVICHHMNDLRTYEYWQEFHKTQKF